MAKCDHDLNMYLDEGAPRPSSARPGARRRHKHYKAWCDAHARKGSEHRDVQGLRHSEHHTVKWHQNQARGKDCLLQFMGKKEQGELVRGSMR
ncbi:hypothetical protein HAX54_027924, partial [Datura stramonium]|nr:hypothetical protein [Datura stramonium]